MLENKLYGKKNLEETVYFNGFKEALLYKMYIKKVTHKYSMFF